jgi:hypothetical protein
VAKSLPQESLPAVTGNVQVGTTGGTAAALLGKAIKPTPRAPAEARSNAIRLLERIDGISSLSCADVRKNGATLPVTPGENQA